MIRISFLLILSSFLLVSNVSASETIAFGYLNNKSGDKNYDYLETIFPNSFATSITISGIEAIKPLKVNEHLKENFNINLKKDYDFTELPELVEKIDSDLFIFGSFNPLPNNRIKIVLHLYFRESKEMLTFTNIGRMETEIFRLVDMITATLINVIDKFYKTERILPGSRLAILTNIDGEDINKLYYSFLKKRYRIIFFQSNDLSLPLNGLKFNKFRYIETTDNSYTIITDWRKIKFYHGTWTGIKYNERVKYLKRIFKKYDRNYIENKNRLFEKLNKTFGNKIDHILIIGFNEYKDKAWLRCINIRRRDLIWIQSNIESDLLARDNLLNITDKIIDCMTKVSKNIASQ